MPPADHHRRGGLLEDEEPLVRALQHRILHGREQPLGQCAETRGVLRRHAAGHRLAVLVEQVRARDGAARQRLFQQPGHLGRRLLRDSKGPAHGLGDGGDRCRLGPEELEHRWGPAHHSRSLPRRRALDWLCSWHTRDSVTPSTAAISFRFMSCS
jgi:hypothetical protein